MASGFLAVKDNRMRTTPRCVAIAVLRTSACADDRESHPLDAHTERAVCVIFQPLFGTIWQMETSALVDDLISLLLCSSSSSGGGGGGILAAAAAAEAFGGCGLRVPADCLRAPPPIYRMILGCFRLR